MSKERLEEIKVQREKNRSRNMPLTNDLVTDNFNWLIKQAERVQELEGENRALRAVAKNNKYIGEGCLEQNKRYREAIKAAYEGLKWITPGKSYAASQVLEILSKALEEIK